MNWKLIRHGRDASVEPQHLSTGPGKSLLRGALRILFRVRVTGDQSVFANDRTLIVANHESFLDGLLLAVFLPVSATFVVHAQITKSWLVRRLLSFVPHLVVDSASPLAIKQTIRLVETGTPVVIFPEGRLTVTGSLMKVYDGAGFRCWAPVKPTTCASKRWRRPRAVRKLRAED